MVLSEIKTLSLLPWLIARGCWGGSLDGRQLQRFSAQFSSRTKQGDVIESLSGFLNNNQPAVKVIGGQSAGVLRETDLCQRSRRTHRLRSRDMEKGLCRIT